MLPKVGVMRQEPQRVGDDVADGVGAADEQDGGDLRDILIRERDAREATGDEAVDDVAGNDRAPHELVDEVRWDVHDVGIEDERDKHLGELPAEVGVPVGDEPVDDRVRVRVLAGRRL